MSESRFAYVTYIRTTPEKLWRALLEPEFTRQFWCETWQDSEWKPGASWRLMAPDGRMADEGEILEIEPGRRLVLTWRHQLSDEMREEGHSRMTCELEPVGESVKLSILHEIDRPGSKLIESVSEGWPHLLASLKSLLETGEPLAETRLWPEGL
ncbi:SRPBCC family protein [Tundrisphaera sp. TA3]|uniref:SRPBCC family protein n=1 Tax=Tundrisphaera sp. TA3 TaxID=3435775 RepID=UPI003EBCE72E